MRTKIALIALASLMIFQVQAAETNQTMQAGIGPSFSGPLGLQLYSLRDYFAKDVPGTIARVHDFGFHYAETAGNYGLAPAKFKEMLAAQGVKVVSAHLAFERFRDDLPGVLAEAKALELEWVGCAWIPHQGDMDEKTIRATAATFNRVGEELSQHGLKFFYHIHGYEFQPHDKGTLFDLLLAETNPKYVSYELDVFWAAFPGQDPAKLLEKYGDRFPLLHLKDMKKDLKTGSLSGSTSSKNCVPLGTGQLDVPAILRAAKKADAKYYFIEDESAACLTQIPVSLRYLEQIRF